MKKKIKRKKKKTNKFPRFKKFVEETVDEIRETHGLKDFQVYYKYLDRVEKAPHNKVKLAQVLVDDKYLTAEVVIHQPMFEHFQEHNLGTIREALCHEMAHIRTVPLVKLAEDRFVCPEEIDKYSEIITELMGRMMYKLLYVKPKIKYKK